MTITNARKRIAQIDKQINEVRRQLRTIETIDLMSAASWQAAWDKHPDLQEREHQLFRERGQMQLVRDEFQAKISAKKHVSQRLAERRAATKTTGVFSYLYEAKKAALLLGKPELAAWYDSGLRTVER